MSSVVTAKKIEQSPIASEIALPIETASAPPLLEMRGIGRKFPGVVALDAVDFAVDAGECVALVGENGAGKSTLMKILGGIVAPDAGTISINGETVKINSASDALDLKIGFIHQELNVLDNLDVAGNVFLGREPLRGGILRLVDRRKMETETAKYLRLLGLNISPKTLVRKLSTAQRQLVEIAKALSTGARLLIMDEPTSSLTLGETARLVKIVKDLRANQNVSVVYISHRLAEVEELAERVIVLRDGRNAGTLTGKEISHDAIVRLMVGRDLRHKYQAPAHEIAGNYFAVEDLQTTAFPRKKVAFSIGKGEILGLAGLVGAGRSETARAIFGIDRKKAGKIFLDNKEIRINSPRDAIRAGVYLVPEDRRGAGLIVEDCIRENVVLPALRLFANFGLVSRARERVAAFKAAEDFKVKAASIETAAKNLSGGNQQKVVLAKWLALNPKVLIFDEPTRGVDVGGRAEIYAIIRALAAAGVACLVISSDMEEVLGLSDRIAVMHEGAISGFLTRENCNEEAVMQLATGKTQPARNGDEIDGN